MAGSGAGLVGLATACILLGLVPVQIVERLRSVALLLQLAPTPSSTAAAEDWWRLTPLDSGASYAPVLVLAAIAMVVLLAFLAVRALYHGRVRRGPAWDGGYGALGARVQDSPVGFGQPVRRIFAPLFIIEREVPAPSDRAPRYRLRIVDRCWAGLYQPLRRLVQGAADLAGRVQQGRLAIYLTYSFVTLLLLLGWVL